ncbi:cation:proton antiporter [Exiguobacterium flavidum]|uniref:cation:proton antiporter n=1 Tax=Exiguobacterium flavidum TaxID=2184695 RepID=UPI000DF76AA3|nr:cation:proton antiporter [Exiguobacterium flavidum]
MEELDLHHVFELGLVLVMLAAGITAVAKKMNQPYPIALVIVGTLIGLANVPILEPVKSFITEGEVFNFVIITLFLPALLGEASLKLPFPHLKDNRKPIISLAFLGTLLSFLIIGFAGIWLLDLPVPAAFVFAALMSATDPVSVLSIFKSVGVPKRLATIIEGESLFNDGLAVVLFKISSLYLLTYLDLGVAGFGLGLLEFVRVIALGLLVGAIFGYAFSQLTKLYDDYPLEIIFSIILFYGAFLAAETFEASGVIAVVVAALIFGNYGARIGMSPTTKLNINSFWDVAALLANSLVFLMVGLEITQIDLMDKWGLIAIAIMIVLVARAVSVYASISFLKNVPLAWGHILNWGGLKGSLSIALALSLPRSFEGRETVLVLAFSVVLFSLVVQGLSIKPLLRLLGTEQKDDAHLAYEALVARSHRYESAVSEIRKARSDLFLTEASTRDLLSSYEDEVTSLRSETERLFERYPELKERQQTLLRRLALYAEHEAIERLVREEIISREVAEREIELIMDELVRLEDTH